MSRAVVLGSGTSNGVPMLGVEYPPEFLANPKNWRTRCSLLLEGPTGNVLVDCAPEMRLQLLKAECQMVEAVIVTHTHADHIMGMDDLRSFCIVRNKAPFSLVEDPAEGQSKIGRREGLGREGQSEPPLPPLGGRGRGMEGQETSDSFSMPIYTLPRYQEHIRRVFAYAFVEHGPGIEAPKFDLRDVPNVLSVAGLEIQTMLVDHGPAPVIALRVGDFAYVTDVSFIPPAAEQKLQGLRTLILDAVRYKPHPNHYHFEAAIEVAQKLGAETTFFTHLSHDYDHDAVEAELPAGIRLAYDGLAIEI